MLVHNIVDVVCCIVPRSRRHIDNLVNENTELYFIEYSIVICIHAALFTDTCNLQSL